MSEPTMEQRLGALENTAVFDAKQREERQHVLDTEIAEMKSGFSGLRDDILLAVEKMRVTIFGNGKVEGSICWEMQAMKRDISELEKKVNGMLGTDNWRRELLLKGISSVFTSILVVVLIQLAKVYFK
jgi:hypothetical protein